MNLEEFEQVGVTQVFIENDVGDPGVPFLYPHSTPFDRLPDSSFSYQRLVVVRKEV